MLRVLTFLFCTVCWPQQFTEVDLRLKGVGLGSSYASVLRRLGNPLSRKREKIIDEFEVCGPPYTLIELRYNGATIELHGDLRGRNFEVVGMEITSAKLFISPGIRIGMTEAEVRSKLGGPPVDEATDAGTRILYYVTKDNLGGGAFHFRNGRLVKIIWNYTLC